MTVLLDQVEAIREEDSDAKMIIFAESKRTVDKICGELRQLQIPSLPFYESMGAQSRTTTLSLL
jgi:superfamily II DNA/RNA helicase